VDYWRTQVSNEVLKLKVKYLLAQVDQVHGYLDEVKTVDAQLREILKYQNDKGKTASVIQPASLDSAGLSSAGGPTLLDQSDLARTLDSQDPNLSWERLMTRTSSMKAEARQRIESFEKLTEWMDDQKRVFLATPRGWPCKGNLTSHFGKRLNPFHREGEEVHLGIDIAGPSGTPIRATADGVVRVATWKAGYGNVVVLNHDCGFQSRYAHNSRLLVRSGDKVKRGQTIALMGATGRASGPHCHYEIWRYNQRKNPVTFLKEDPTGTGGILTRGLDVKPVAPTETKTGA
jgi:murein DD-endopeptidase MepM/ murein hydrolase activator NlpD